MNTMPNIRKVFMTPVVPIRYPAIFAVMKAENPKPRSVSPTAVPRRSGNQRAATATGTPYAIPTPMPPMIPYTMYSIQTEVTVDASSHPRPVSIPPMMVILRGPMLSMYFPVSVIAMAKNARNTENGIRISFAVTVSPSVS